MLNIHELMKRLSERRPIFHSEADFQFALAWHIKETFPRCEVRLEWKPFLMENLHIDLWLPTYATAIELKYPASEPLDVCHNGERFKPGRYQPEQARYDFVKDIGRIERIVAERDDVEHGFAVLLTNRERLWKTPIPKWEDTYGAAFRIHTGRELSGTRAWSPKRKSSTRGNPIHLQGSYEMCWRDYYSFDAGGRSRFRYLAVEVSN